MNCSVGSFLLTATLAGLLSVSGCGATNSLVDGECAPEYAQCGLACVDLTSDPQNCGTCANACTASKSCTAGACSAVPPATGKGPGAGGPGVDGGGSVSPVVSPIPNEGGADGAIDPTSDASSLADSAAGDAMAADAGVPDAGEADGSAGNAADGSAGNAADGSAGNAADGSAGNAADATAGDSSTADAAPATADASLPLCAVPLTECNGRCVDERTDPANCGTCGKVCPSNLCAAGLCEGKTPGDDIVIGHDYSATWRGSSQARALANAVLLPSSNPLRILSFEHYAPSAAVANVKAIVAAAAAGEGRSLSITVSMTDSDVPDALTIATYDVLIVYDQADAKPGVLAALGTSWAPALATFLGAGGDVVALDGAAGSTAEMPRFEAAAGLLAVTSHAALSEGTALTVANPGDSVALGVLSPYGADVRSARFSTTETRGENVAFVVVEPASGDPVIVHKTIVRGANQ